MIEEIEAEKRFGRKVVFLFLLGFAVYTAVLVAVAVAWFI